MYGTLATADDVDYFTFSGRHGQEILVRVDIPQIPGLEGFAPTVALTGPGLPPGARIIAPPAEKPPAFFEPFTQTSYWTRQVDRITLPADGRYQIAVYHPEGQTGRYVLSVGDKEVPGGDPLFREKLRRFFTP